MPNEPRSFDLFAGDIESEKVPPKSPLREPLERFIFGSGIYKSALTQPGGMDHGHDNNLPGILMRYGHIDGKVFIQLRTLENAENYARVELEIPRVEHPVQAQRPIFIKYEGETDAIAGLIARAKKWHELNVAMNMRLSGDVADDPLDGAFVPPRPLNGHTAQLPIGLGFGVQG